MEIKYKIQEENYSLFLRDKIDKSLENKINSINSDKKILFVYDKKIEKKLINQILKILKNSGCFIVALEFQGSKKNKNEKTMLNLIDIMLDNKFTKKSIVISFGGGVLGDVAALAASLYYRGTIYFNIPSTMTSIIDSCVGGKTGINFRNIINSIGNYYHPNAVFIYNEVIKSIPNREFIAGIPEIIKCGLIKKNRILKILQNKKKEILTRNFKVISNLCAETLKTKIFFFKNDVNEKNKRLILNFGHTFAHSIEMATERLTKKEYYRHGEAVGLGILCEIYFSNMGENKLLKNVEGLLKLYGLPIKIDKGNFHNKKHILLNNIYKFIFLDKKKISRYPRYISMKKLNKPTVKELQNNHLILETINNFI